MPSILECLYKNDEGFERIKRMKRYLGQQFPTVITNAVSEYLTLDQETIKQRTEFLNILKNNKIDPNIKDINDIIIIAKIHITPLILAAKESLGKVMTAFLDNGAEVDKESSMLTAVLSTIDNNNEELTKLLITYQASPPPYDRRNPARSDFYDKCKAEVDAKKHVVAAPMK